MNKLLFVFLVTVLMTSGALANPTGGSVVSGNIQINTPNNNVTVIHQSTNRGIINWQSFNINKGQRTSFYNGNGITLNRVTGTQSPSMIYGTLTATGKIILVNQSGIFFGPSARVDVAGIMASTSNISNANFNAGKYIFDGTPSTNAAIVNQGRIIANHGLVALVGSNVSNEGYIRANLGEVVLASGNKFTVDLAGDHLINFTIDEPTNGASTTDAIGRTLKSKVNNSGKIYADGGTILMTARTAENVLDHAINMSGIAEATSVSEHNGEIILSAGPNGAVDVSGTLAATGGKHHSGGTVKVLGNSIHLASSAKVDVSGDTGGGNIMIGGDAHGAGPDMNATTTTVDNGATLIANALTQGNGGNIVVWANDNTQFDGNISAQGGPLGGNGGFAETSAHYLTIGHDATVNTLAPKGTTGTWLLDPYSLNISSGFTSLVNSTGPGTPPNTFFPVAAVNNLDTSDLTLALNMSAVLIDTTIAGGSGSGDIAVNNSITWSSPFSLTLNAAGSISLGSGVQISGSGGGGLALNFNQGTNGSLSFGSGSSVSASGGVSVNGNSSTLGTPGSNTLNLSGLGSAAHLTLSGTKAQGFPFIGFFTIGNGQQITFSNINNAIGNGGTISLLNPPSTIKITINGSSISINDPFTSTGLTPTFLVGSSNAAAVQGSATQMTESTGAVLIPAVDPVTSSIDTLIAQITKSYNSQMSVQKFGCH